MDEIHMGVYCGEHWYSLMSWGRYPLFRKISLGFSIGPILFWYGQR